MQGLTLWGKVHFSGALVPSQSALWVCHLWNWLGGALVCLKLATICVGSGASWKSLVQAKVSWLPVPNPGPPARSYRVICSWKLHVLGLEAPGRG